MRIIAALGLAVAFAAGPAGAVPPIVWTCVDMPPGLAPPPAPKRFCFPCEEGDCCPDEICAKLFPER